ncbi:MAG: nucleoside kinase [Clostridiales bacterium]|nr:nucleoside kinase [Clostridiales bacterium]
MRTNNANGDMESVINVVLEGKKDSFPKGTMVKDIVSQLLDRAEAERVLCVMQGGVCLELNEPIMKDCELRSITFQDEEGRRVYERSLRFLFLLSMKRLYPDKQVRMLNSVGYGLYIALLEGEMGHGMTRAIQSDMEELARQDLPFHKETWTREDAIAYFQKEGWQDKADLLRYRPKEKITMYRIGALCEYFYGVMLPSTGYIKAFALKAHFPGVVLLAPSPQTPDVPAPYVQRSKFLREFSQSQQWCGILGAQNAVDVNRMIKDNKIREFIRINEALHDRSIAGIADEIVSRKARIVMIFGPSSSGKTTFANRLSVHLRVLGQHPKLISLDDFYRNRSEIPLEADGKPDLEHVNALDIPLLAQSLEGLLSGKTVSMPRFDFTSAHRVETGYDLSLADGGPLLLEGIHGMNDLITSEIPEQMMYGIYVSALSCINLDDHNRIRTTDVRLLRRAVRDMRFRNTSIEETIDMWPKVRAGEEKWIFPNQEKADVMFNTSLHYELPVLKTMAYELLLAIPKSAPEYLIAHRLLKVLHYFLPVGGDVMDEIPPLSILREFIGECSFYDTH